MEPTLLDDVTADRSPIPNFEQYKLLTARRQSFTQMIWQIPVIAAGANGILISKAFEVKGTVTGITVAVLAVAVSLASLQLLARHRLNERIDTQLIRLFEDANPTFARTVAEKGGNNALHLHVFGEHPGLVARLPSGTIWNIVLVLVSIFSISALVANILYVTGMVK